MCFRDFLFLVFAGASRYLYSCRVVVIQPFFSDIHWRDGGYVEELGDLVLLRFPRVGQCCLLDWEEMARSLVDFAVRPVLYTRVLRVPGFGGVYGLGFIEVYSFGDGDL